MLHKKRVLNQILKTLVNNHPHPCSLAMIQIKVDASPKYIAEELKVLERENKVIVEENKFSKVYRPIPQDLVTSALWPSEKMTLKTLTDGIEGVFEPITISFKRKPAGVFVPPSKWAKLLAAAGPDWDK